MWLIRDTVQQFQIHEAGARGADPLHLRFPDIVGATLFLRRFLADPLAMNTLRAVLQHVQPRLNTFRLNDEQVVRLLAEAVLMEHVLIVANEAPPMWPVRFARDGGKFPEGPPAKPAKPVDPEESRAPVDWRLVFSDGKPVKGWKSLFEPPQNEKPKELTPDGQGRHQIGGYMKDDGYQVTIIGTVAVKGKVQDPEGKAVAKARVTIERAYGDPVEVWTDGAGAFETKGFVEEEELAVAVVRGTAQAEGQFVDEEGQPVAGVRAILRLERGDAVQVQSGKDGKFKIEGLVPGEGYSLEVVECPAAIEGRFIDEKGKPVSGVAAVLHLDGGRHVPVQSNEAGKFKIDGLLPGEGAALEILEPA
jgi:hypothetical protein